MLNSQMEINKLEEEKQLLINRIKFLEEELNYSRCNNNRSNLSTNNSHIHNSDVAREYNDLRMATDEEAEQLANAYAEAMNIDIKEVM